MVLTSILTPITTGLLTTLEVDAVLARLICYQALFGFGCGIGYQGPQSAAQTVLSPHDAAIGIALMQFANSFGPAVFVSIAQTIFTGRLAANLEAYAPRLNASSLVKMGLADLKEHVGLENLAGALLGYDPCTDADFLPRCWVDLSFIGRIGGDGMEIYEAEENLRVVGKLAELVGETCQDVRSTVYSNDFFYWQWQ